MADFRGADLSGARFDQVDLSGATFRDVALRGVTMRGVELTDVDIDGELRDVRVNGVDVAPLVEAELDRRHPERPLMRPTDPAGFRVACLVLDRLWGETLARARRLDPERLHESVDGEWSFTETLRHLVFATEAWVLRAVLGDPAPWHPLSLPWDQLPEDAPVPRDRTARPPLEEVVALREDRWGRVKELVDSLDAERLEASTTPVDAPGWPPPRAFEVRECLRIVLNEEWQHRVYAERDLAVLEARG